MGTIQKTKRKNPDSKRVRGEGKPADLTLAEKIRALFKSIESDYVTPEQSKLIHEIQREINQ